ncbi:protein C1orf43 homolog [Clavelina lepadiformis]|uniref:protein C1orf43 homolog n=1 Tax=Clavelina lepadiformis TaxID=159417 RepID=UPI00404273CF
MAINKTINEQFNEVVTTIQPTSQSTTTTLNNGFHFDTAGPNLLLVLIYGAIIVVMVAIFVKRLVHRVRLKFSQQRQLNPGSGAPKKLQLEIKSGLDEAAQLIYEPQLFSQQDSNAASKEDRSEYKQIQQNCSFRIKTITSFVNLDNVLCGLSKELKRPMGKSVRQHLFDVKSHSSGVMRSVRTSHLQAISDLYMQARYGSESYGMEEHERFDIMTNDIVSILQQRSHRKRSKEIARELHRQNATLTEDNMRSHNGKENLPTSSAVVDKEPLLTQCDDS